MNGGESATVDFKIQCNAFNTREPNAEKAKAELVKDVCAMANNQGTASHLIIGVSDNGQDFGGVSNPNLTDDNLQTLCKDAISPPPRIRSKLVEVPPSYGSHPGKKCLIIQVGPHPANIFHLNRDFISADDAEAKYRFNFKKHEIWIRRGATSGLASPAEITNLTGPRVAVSSAPPSSASVDDPKMRDLVGRIRRVFEEHGVEPGHLARFFKIRKTPFGIELRDAQTDTAFLNWLDETKIDWIAKTFLIRREWIDGEDESVHEQFSFDKNPGMFFSTISRHSDGTLWDDVHSQSVAYFIRWGVGKEWKRKGQSQVFVVVAVPLARFSNERIVYKYITDFEPYSWEYSRTSIQLRAWARLLNINKSIHCSGREIDHTDGERFESNTGFLRELIENRLKRPRDDWHPEDYALYPEESGVAKGTDTFPDVIGFLQKHNLPWEPTGFPGRKKGEAGI